jgi:hypothetical protein
MKVVVHSSVPFLNKRLGIWQRSVARLGLQLVRVRCMQAQQRHQQSSDTYYHPDRFCMLLQRLTADMHVKLDLHAGPTLICAVQALVRNLTSPLSYLCSASSM